ncbi:MAG: hypothetical protein O6939_04780 [Bacteroidetes bacterium]|nr:hypothetical protein [Bacteroidota bacterium]MCZ6900933.1 hypothetical protein [Bacteroidota bacterium]
MKTTILYLSILLVSWISFPSNAQVETPKKEFNVRLVSNNIDIAPGEVKSVEVFINRSKSYRKTKVELTLASKLPDGVTIEFENNQDLASTIVMHISASGDAAIDSYNLILNGRSNRGAKGTIFKLNVQNPNITGN